MQNKQMNNQLISISMAEADVFAMEYFLKMCGLNREGEKYRRMLKQGMDIKDRIKAKVDIKAVMSSFPGNSISKNKADLNGAVFQCNAFQRLDPEHITGVYAYILTAGTFELDSEEPILDQLYADIWGTAYVDAGIEVLKRIVEADQLENNDINITGNSNAGNTAGTNTGKITVLDSFGPGFFGMGVDQIGKFFEILDGGKHGVKARSNSLMLPLKSCAGVFVAVDDETRLPASDCRSCESEYKNCIFCQRIIKENQ